MNITPKLRTLACSTQETHPDLNKTKHKLAKLVNIRILQVHKL